MSNKPNKKKTTLEDLAAIMQNGFKEVRADIKSIHDDLMTHDKKMDEIIEKVNENGDRLSSLMTREEAIRLFDMATLKIEHDHMKKIIREKLHVEI